MLTQDYFTLEGDYRTFGSKDLRINVNWWIWGAGCSGNLNNAGTLKLKTKKAEPRRLALAQP